MHSAVRSFLVEKVLLLGNTCSVISALLWLRDGGLWILAQIQGRKLDRVRTRYTCCAASVPLHAESPRENIVTKNGRGRQTLSQRATTYDMERRAAKNDRNWQRPDAKNGTTATGRTFFQRTPVSGPWGLASPGGSFFLPTRQRGIIML